MTNTTPERTSVSWWDAEHRHTKACWWNWEIGRWICGGTSNGRR